MLESPQHTSSWYLNSEAIHHVSNDPSIFTSIHPASGIRVRGVGGKNDDVAGVGNVDIQVLSRAIKSISSVLYTPDITKNCVSVGSLFDQNKTLIFKSEGCFIVDNTTLDVVAFAPRKNRRGMYKLGGNLTTLGLEVNSLHHHSHATLWH